MNEQRGIMQAYYGVALVTLLTGLVYFGMAAMVSRTHAKSGILAPTMPNSCKSGLCFTA